MPLKGKSNLKRNRKKATSENGPYLSIKVPIVSCPSELKSVLLNTKTRTIKKKLYHYNTEMKNVLQNLNSSIKTIRKEKQWIHVHEHVTA